MKESKHRFGWRELLAIAAALALLVLGGFGVKHLMDRGAAGEDTPLETVLTTTEAPDFDAWDAAVPQLSQREVNTRLSDFTSDSYYRLDQYYTDDDPSGAIGHAATWLCENEPEAFSYVTAAGTKYRVVTLEKLNDALLRLMGQTVTPLFTEDDSFLETGAFSEWCYLHDGSLYWPIDERFAEAEQALFERYSYPAFGVCTALSGYMNGGVPTYGGTFQIYVVNESYSPRPEVDFLLGMSPAEAETLVESGALYRYEGGEFRMNRWADGNLQMEYYQCWDLPETDEDLYEGGPVYSVPEVPPLEPQPSLRYLEFTPPFSNAMAAELTPLYVLPWSGAKELGALWEHQQLTLRRAATVYHDDAETVSDWFLVTTLGGDLGWLPASAVEAYDPGAELPWNACFSIRYGAVYWRDGCPETSYQKTDSHYNGQFIQGPDPDSDRVLVGDVYLSYSDSVSRSDLVPYPYPLPSWFLTLTEKPDGPLEDMEPEEPESPETEPEEPQTEDTGEEESPEDLEDPETLALKQEIDELISAPWSWYNRALSSRYAAPEQVDLYELFYDGIPEAEAMTEEEAAMLYGEYGDDYPGPGYDKLPPEDMDRVLTEYFGLSLEQTAQRGLRGFRYEASTDCYYHCHGDTNQEPHSVEAVRRLADGSVLFTYKSDFWNYLTGGIAPAVRTAALRPKGNGGYLLVSNLPGEWVTAEDLGALSELCLGGTFRAETTAADGTKTVRELQLGGNGELYYREGDPDSEFSQWFWGWWWTEDGEKLRCALCETTEVGNRMSPWVLTVFDCRLDGEQLKLTQRSETGFGDDAPGTELCFRPAEQE